MWKKINKLKFKHSYENQGYLYVGFSKVWIIYKEPFCSIWVALDKPVDDWENLENLGFEEKHRFGEKKQQQLIKP